MLRSEETSPEVDLVFAPEERRILAASGPDYLPSRVKLFDANGSLIAQSPEMVILPGESRSFKFNGDALHLQRDPGASRARARIKPFFNFESVRLSVIETTMFALRSQSG